MKVCKVKTTYSDCKLCIDIQESYNQIKDCSKCKKNTDEYEILDFASNFWGSYAILLCDGKSVKVSIDRLYDIREK